MYLRTIGLLSTQMTAYLIVMNNKSCKITVFRKHSMLKKKRSLARGVLLFDAQWEIKQVTKKVRLHEHKTPLPLPPQRNSSSPGLSGNEVETLFMIKVCICLFENNK